MILNKDNCAYISFYNALLHEGYKDLAALLHSGLPRVSSSSGKDTDGGLTSFGVYPDSSCHGAVFVALFAGLIAVELLESVFPFLEGSRRKK